MNPKLVILGIQTILKIICEKIIIKNINIINKSNNFNGKIDELHIRAESIIFNKINISNLDIYIRDIFLRFQFYKKKFLINNCIADVHMRLSKDNINRTIHNKKWNRLKTSIESFISMSFQSIDINKNSIYFINSDGFTKSETFYTLEYEKHNISLVNNNNQEKLPILNDKNIIINNLVFSKSYIGIELTSKIMIN